jgi:hypothetical protein
VNPDLGGCHRYPEGAGDLLVGEIVVDAKEQSRSLTLRQMANSAEHRRQTGLGVQPGERVIARGAEFLY